MREASRYYQRITIFLASPVDLERERATVRTVAAEFNRTWSGFLGVELEIVGWEDVPSGIAQDPQEVINRYVGNDYNVFLGLMGTSLGSPTGRAASGTVEEYERALARWQIDPEAVQLKFYFRTIPSGRRRVAAPAAVEEFKVRLDRDGVLYKIFHNARDLEQMLRHDLSITAQEWFSRKLEAEAEPATGDAGSRDG